MLGVVDVFQAVVAEVTEGGAVGEVVLDERPGGVRQQDLAAVAGRRDPGGPVDVDPPVVVPARSALPGVEPHPDPDLGIGEIALGGHGRPDGADRRGEHHEEGVAFGPDLGAAAGGDCPPHDLGVGILELLVAIAAELLEEPRGPLDVREQKRDGPGGELAHFERMVEPASVACTRHALWGGLCRCYGGGASRSPRLPPRVEEPVPSGTGGGGSDGDGSGGVSSSPR
jgi:hypothetical protein